MEELKVGLLDSLEVISVLEKVKVLLEVLIIKFVYIYSQGIYIYFYFLFKLINQKNYNRGIEAFLRTLVKKNYLPKSADVKYVFFI